MERNICLDWPQLVQEAIKRRKEQGLTQEQLAALVGVSKPTVNRFESGKLNLTLDNAVKILRVFGLVV